MDMGESAAYSESRIKLADNGILTLTSYAKMNLNQAFCSTTAGHVYIFQGLHCWHRGYEVVGLVLRPVLKMRMSELKRSSWQ